MNIKTLTRKRIKSIEINERRDLIALDTDDGIVFLSAVGDCCSHSWFEHIQGLEALVGHEIRGVEDRQMPDIPDKPDEYEVIKSYGWSIITERGRCELEMRNSSNGYYGGWIEVSESSPLDQYSSPRTPSDKDELKTLPLTEDF